MKNNRWKKALQRSSGRSNSENDLVVKETQLHSIISRGFAPTLVIKLKGMEE